MRPYFDPGVPVLPLECCPGCGADVGDIEIITDGAISRIWEESGGIPRSINTLCDMSLVYGFSNDCSAIDESVVSEMLGDRREFAVQAGKLEETKQKDVEEKPNGETSLFERLVQLQQ